MCLNISKFLFSISALLLSINSIAQLNTAVNKSDSIKSMEYIVNSVRIKNDKIIKRKPSLAYDYYPIQYSFTKSYYSTDAFLIKKDNPNQKDTTYYNTKNQEIIKVLYPGKTKDSIVIFYSYDSQGNIESKKMSASAQKLDYKLGSNYYSYESLIDEFYQNYYMLKNDTTVGNQFNKEKMKLNCYYRLYNQKNKLIKEKYLTTHKNSFPNKTDSTLHTIIYTYTKENKISKITKLDEYKNALGENYTLTNIEQHNYFDTGLIHEIKYFKENKLWRKERFVKNTEERLTEYTQHWISPNRTITYLYNSKGELTDYTFTRKKKKVRNITLEYTYNNRGHWITCTHYDKKNKPKYLIERIIEYYK